MALRCLLSLSVMGWESRIIVDPSEWPEGKPPGTIAANYAGTGRMHGNACHEAILGAMLDNSDDGDVVAKFDCDIRLSESASDWLSGASESGRGFRLGKNLWGGLWAAQRRQVARLAQIAPTIQRCNCAESHLSICGLRANGGFDPHADLVAETWRLGTGWPESAGVLTLPRKCVTASRADYGNAMFDLS